MVSEKFELDDLIWAKMKGYPYWPGKIVTPPDYTKSKSKRNQHYVLFFGSENYAWIANDLIELHSEDMVKKYGQRKGENFRKAVQTIIEQSKDVSKSHSLTGQTDKAGLNQVKSDRVVNNESEKIEKKPSLATSGSTAAQKSTRKRHRSPDPNQPTTSASLGFGSGKESETIPEKFTLYDIYEGAAIAFNWVMCSQNGKMPLNRKCA